MLCAPAPPAALYCASPTSKYPFLIGETSRAVFSLSLVSRAPVAWRPELSFAFDSVRREREIRLTRVRLVFFSNFVSFRAPCEFKCSVPTCFFQQATSRRFTRGKITVSPFAATAVARFSDPFTRQVFTFDKPDNANNSLFSELCYGLLL